MQYLSSAAAQSQPFFMVVSLVNPHDVLFYPKTYATGGLRRLVADGRDRAAGDGRRGPRRPSRPCRSEFLKIFNASGPIPTRADEAQLPQLLRQPDEVVRRLSGEDPRHARDRPACSTNTLVIATADHGEMGTAHGGLRQKNFNFYEESTRVPLVYSNPRLFTKPRDRSVARLARRLPADAREPRRRAGRAPATSWQGVDYSEPDPERARAKPPQDYIVFTYDDWQSGQATRPVPEAAEPHRQHPRAALQARALLRRRRQGARPVGDVRPQGRPARAHQPRLHGPQAHARAASASTSACGASSRASSARGCSHWREKRGREGGDLPSSAHDGRAPDRWHLRAVPPLLRTAERRQARR